MSIGGFFKAFLQPSPVERGGKAVRMGGLILRASSYHPDGFVIIRGSNNINDRLMVHYTMINVGKIRQIRDNSWLDIKPTAWSFDFSDIHFVRIFSP